MKLRTPLLLAGAAIVVALLAISAGTGFLVDWLWFESLGYGAVFTTAWIAKAATGAATGAAVFVILLANGMVAARAAAPPLRRLRVVRANGGYVEIPDLLQAGVQRLPWTVIVVAAAVVLAVLIGIAQAGNWALFLRWHDAQPFGRTDPLFGHDLGFYVFTLPVYGVFRDAAVLVLFLAAMTAGVVYWGRGFIETTEGFPRLAAVVIRHGSVLLAVFFALKIFDYWLQRYDLLLNDNGVVFGAAYTDVHMRLPLLAALMAIAAVAAVLSAANVAALGSRLPVAAVVVLFGASLLSTFIPAAFQSYRVKPDELRLESPYIARNIALTQYGFGLNRVESRPFPAEGKLTPAVLAANQGTTRNLRWWDPRPLLETYRQLQEIRLYYDFADVDVDRYVVDGAYQQVMLSAREMNQSRLPADAQTWINQHFKFTHGIGLAMSPVNQFDDEGLPALYVKDIPPASSAGVRIERPQIYYGEQASNYVIVGGGSKEFDYPKGQENVYTTYSGSGGVALDRWWKRLLFAWYFGDVKLLISGNVTADSQLLFRRALQERLTRLAPFLRLDRDPYIVIADGRLVWLQDAYTTSDVLPYAQRSRGSGINYIRNAVKIATDAYDGSVVFYVADTADPIIQTYQRIFPSMFRPLEQMPPALREHIRYPEDLFVVQAAVYGTYHMTDPEVFYNREDQWSFPQESTNGQSMRMQPYYTIMRLPGEPREEFILMLPMVPNNRDNMIAWLAARCDGAAYGALIEYAFPKEKLIYGPAQIEARIDQDTTISQQLSLWNQIGSRVIRGNLLVIPIDDALLYVEPLYLSAEKRELPELKRLIASYGDRVVMSPRPDSLFALLFGGAGALPAAPAPPPAPSAAAAPAAGPVGGEALQHYRQAIDALRNTDWQTFGREMAALQKALESPAPPP